MSSPSRAPIYFKDHPLPIVQVLWADAFNNSEWMKADQAEFVMQPECLCLSVGFLWKRTKDAVILAGSVSSSGWYCDWHNIPKGMIRKLVVLRRA